MRNGKPYEVVFVLGGPGAGKGTQCALIVENFGYVHLSAGDLLRSEKQSGSDLASMINDYIKEGKIVPAEVTIGLLKTAMEQSGNSKFLIDGFPRNEENLSAWMGIMDSCAEVDFLLFLDCPEDVMEKRLIGRGASSGRADDNLESIRKRFMTYKESTMPIIKHFSAKGKTRRVIADRTVEDVFAEVKSLLVDRVVFVLGGPGSGKGTQCALIEGNKDLGYAHLSAGDLLREERNSESNLAEMINEYIREGKIVPAEVTVGLLKAAMDRSGKRRFLIDGFPRNLDNLDAWETAMEKSAVVDFVLFLDCPEDIMVGRIMERGRSSGRIDDNKEAIRKRLETYRESTMPIVKKFAGQGLLRKVDSNQNIDEVQQDVRKHILSLQ
ncbi:unnamed protein product [Discosporangium mesarthrocarpum]